MSDPTKNLPWRVGRYRSPIGPVYEVRDAAGNLVLTTHNEALARMVAAGSVAGELYAVLGRILYAGQAPEYPPAAQRTFDEVVSEAEAALAKAAPLLDRKENQP